MNKERFISLAEIQHREEQGTYQYDTHVTVNTLGIPVGVDLDRIGFNILAAERTRKILGTKALHIYGERVQNDVIEIGGRIQPDGTILSARVRTLTNLHPNTDSNTLDGQLYDDQSEIILPYSGQNNVFSEVSDAYDVKKQATLLNKQLKQGLRDLSPKVTMSRYEGIPHNIKTAFLPFDGYVLFVLGTQLSRLTENTPENLENLANFTPTLLAFQQLSLLGMRGLIKHQTGEKIQHSLFFIHKLDRLGASLGFIASHKYFTAAK